MTMQETHLLQSTAGPEPEPEPDPKPEDLGCHCESVKDVMFRASGTQTGGIREVYTGKPDACCDLCRNDPTNQCTHYTWVLAGPHEIVPGKEPKNCMLLAYGGDEPLIKHNTPGQNRTSGYLRRWKAPAPDPSPPAPPTPTPGASGKLSPEMFVKELKKEGKWAPDAAVGLLGMSMLMCLAAFGRRSGHTALGDSLDALKRSRKETASRREYTRIGEATAPAAPDVAEVATGSLDTLSMASSSSRSVSSISSSVSSVSDETMPSRDEQTLDAFVDDFVAAISKLVRDRRHLLRTYEQCFVGSEALEWIKYWLRAAGDDDSDDSANALAQRLLDMETITDVTTDGPPCKFVAEQFYRVRAEAHGQEHQQKEIEEAEAEAEEAIKEAIMEEEEEEDDDDDDDGFDFDLDCDSLGSSDFPSSEVSHTSTMMDFDLRSSVEMHDYEQAVQVLSSALNTGVRPSDACLTRLSVTIPPLLAASVRLRALTSCSSTPNLAALLDQSGEVKAKKPDAEIAEQARALQEALQQHDGITTHTLYTKADRLRVTVLALQHEAADATRRYNLRNCPLLTVLSVDGVRATVMRHLSVTDLCRMRSVCLASADFAAEVLRESAMPTLFGGLHNGRAIASVDQLCGANMQWIQLPPMLAARHDPGTCNMSSGGVIVAGGRDEINVLSSVEEFDPVKRCWVALPPMKTARLGCRASRLPDGRVIVMGGFDGRRAVASVEAYSHSTRSWTPLRDMLTARTGFAAGTLPDGTIVVAGGFGAGGALSAAERYIPATGEWHSLPDMAMERSGCDGCVSSSGELWVAGGMSKGERLDSCEVLRVAEQADRCSWAMAPSMQFARHKLGLCTIAGQLVAMGGEGAPNSPRAAQTDVTSVEVFDAQSQQWRHMVDLPDSLSTSRGCTSI